MFEYLIGLLPFALVWTLVFILRSDLRSKLLYSSLICMPFGALDVLFIPHYWNPPSLFGLVPPIESFMFAFLFGGIASSIYELATSKKAVEIDKEKIGNYYSFETNTWEKWLITVGGLSLLYWGLNLRIMTSSLIIIFILGSIGLIQRSDLFTKTVFSSVFLTFSYFVVLLGLNFFLFPEMFQKWWTHSNLIGISIFNIPVEELIFAFNFGLFFSPLYEVSRKQKIT